MLSTRYMKMIRDAGIHCVTECMGPDSIALFLRRADTDSWFAEDALDWSATFYQEGETALARLCEPRRVEGPRQTWEQMPVFSGTADEVVRSVIDAIMAVDPGEHRVDVRSCEAMLRSVGIHILQEFLGPSRVLVTLRREPIGDPEQSKQSNWTRDWRVVFFHEGDVVAAKVRRPHRKDDSAGSLPQWDDLPLLRGPLPAVIDQLIAIIMRGHEAVDEVS